MSENVIAVTDRSFDDEVLRSEVPVLVDFWATWCGPCRMFGPIFEEVANDYAGKVKMVKVNVDESPDVSQRYHVMSIPTLVLFQAGEVSATHKGMMTQAQLIAFLDENI